MLKENLQRLRKASGFRQEDVARILGIDRSAYSYYECGKTEPNVINLIRIARLFKVDVDALVGNSEYAQALSLGNEPEDRYDSCINADMDSVNKCSSQERYLVSLFRQTEDREGFVSAVEEFCKKEGLIK